MLSRKSTDVLVNLVSVSLATNLFVVETFHKSAVTVTGAVEFGCAFSDMRDQSTTFSAIACLKALWCNLLPDVPGYESQWTGDGYCYRVKMLNKGPVVDCYPEVLDLVGQPDDGSNGMWRARLARQLSCGGGDSGDSGDGDGVV
ncbi:hypothetical protein Tco_1384900 [Tanacetum coccineum]